MNVALTWLIGAIFFAVVGAIVVPRRYRDKGLDDTNTTTAGVLGGFVSGPIIPAILWATTPKLKRLWMVTLTVSNLGVLYGMFATAYPTNLCVVAPYNATYLSQQVANGVVIGAIYALMAVGLTLIYSVAGIVSFTHGQLYMIGGYFSYYFLLLSSNYLTELRGEEVVVNPIFGILVAGVLVFIIGALFERMFLRPMHEGLIERAAEYAILITFGFGFFIEYATLAVAGPFPVDRKSVV